jgi:hypothetical protein
MTDETGSRRYPPATDKRDGYPGSDDGPTMPAPPPDPSGSPPPYDPVKDILNATAAKGPLTGGVIWPPGTLPPAQHGDLNATSTSQLGRVLDPVRAYALAKAVELVKDASTYVSASEALAETAGSTLAIAKEFENYLVDPDGDLHLFAQDSGPWPVGAGPCRICGRPPDNPVHAETP